MSVFTAGVLDQMTFKGPIKIKQLYDSVVFQTFVFMTLSEKLCFTSVRINLIDSRLNSSFAEFQKDA